MALHSKDDVRAQLFDDVYATHDLSVAMPKYKFPEDPRDPRNVYSLIRDELLLDGNSRQNLATFCQTCLLYTSPSPRDQRGSRMPSSA